MGWLQTLLGSGGTAADWNSGYDDGWADARAGADYTAPGTQNDQGWAGYAWGYGEGSDTRKGW
jgi:hypothetical protein